MSFEFTAQQLAAMIPTNQAAAPRWHAAMEEVFPEYRINTMERVAGFVAQCAHESNDFKNTVENLNYSQKGLETVFSRYFGPGKEDAAQYARQPEKIANYVYMDRNRSPRGALGNTQPGDGWLFRGRGLKQLTGRNNYALFGITIGLTPEQTVEYVSTEKGAIESACWFWRENDLNRYADARDIVGLSKRINGGTIGLEDRMRRWKIALKVLGSNAILPAADHREPDVEILDDIGMLRRGMTGDGVRLLQRELGITVDGQFGPATERALRRWQAANGLVADGIAGPKTLDRMMKD